MKTQPNPVSAAATKHSPEPWTTGGSAYPKTIYAEHIPMARTENGDGLDWIPGERCLFESTAKANAARIVACVNALSGLNPEAVKDVVAKFSALLESIESADSHVHRSAKNANACFIDTRTWEGDILGRASEARAALAKLKGEDELS
jgi:hypothetical protein